MSYLDSLLKGLFMLLLIQTAIICQAQDLDYRDFNHDYKGFHFKKPDQKKYNIPFTICNNLIILRVNVNKNDTLNFILDTGAGHILIIDPEIASKLKLPKIKEISITGIGKDQKIPAYISHMPFLSLNAIESTKQGVLVLQEDILHLSEYAGIKIHGILGYEVFSKFVVKINYDQKKITFYNPESFKNSGKGACLPIKLIHQKPYVDAVARIEEDQLDVSLLVDIGAGHALSLEQHSNTSIKLPPKSIKTYLGTTIAGSVYGDIARIKSLDLGGYQLENILTSFPDTNFFVYKIPEREGNLGNNILRRFHLVIDYPHLELLLKPNKQFKEPFYSNLSGIHFLAEAPDFSTYKISYLAPGSPGEKAGLEIGDVLIAVDNEIASLVEMGRIYKAFEKKAGSKIKVFFKRDNQFLVTEVILENKL